MWILITFVVTLVSWFMGAAGSRLAADREYGAVAGVFLLWSIMYVSYVILFFEFGPA